MHTAVINWKLACALAIFPSLIVATKQFIDGTAPVEIAVSALQVFAGTMVAFAAFDFIRRRRQRTHKPFKED